MEDNFHDYLLVYLEMAEQDSLRGKFSRDRRIPQVSSKSLLVILKIVLLIIFKWIFDTLKQFILAGNILKRYGSNSIVTEIAKRMEIARVVVAYFGMLMVDGSKVLSARLALVMCSSCRDVGYVPWSRVGLEGRYFSALR